MSDNGHQLHLHFVFVDRYARIIREYDRHGYDRLQFIASSFFIPSCAFFYLIILNNHEIPAGEAISKSSSCIQQSPSFIF